MHYSSRVHLNGFFRMIVRGVHACWCPSGVLVMLSLFPGVSLRSTPGYLLSSLRDEENSIHKDSMAFVMLNFPMIAAFKLNP